MGADYPDWGGQYNNASFYPLFDMAELAVRLGAPVLHDRRGNVILIETFEYGIDQWPATVDGLASAFSLDTQYVDLPPFAAKMHVSGAIDNKCLIRRAYTTPYAHRIGLNVAFAEFGHQLEFRMSCFYYSATDAYQAGLVVDKPNSELRLYSGAGDVVVATGLALPVDKPAFLQAKLVFNTDTLDYERVMFLGVEYDVSGVPLGLSASANRNHLEIELEAYNTVGTGTDSIWIDNIILTANEPENA